jgi:thiol:disulfide interchange protein DsbC
MWRGLGSRRCINNITRGDERGHLENTMKYQNWLTRGLGALSVVVLAWTAPASAETYSSNVHKDAQDKLTAAISAFAGVPIEIEDIKASPAKGLIEVQIANGPMLYATEDGEYFFLQGDLHAMRNDEVVNVTEEKRSIERRELIDGLNVSDMIVFSPEGETEDYITVFTDISCGYCQKLHREVEQLNNYGIEVRYLAYPRAGMGSEGAKQLETAWCSSNRQETLTKLKSGVKVPMISCNSELIADHYALGGQLGVRGTPAILTSDGRLVPGYQPAANLAKMLGLD